MTKFCENTLCAKEFGPEGRPHDFALRRYCSASCASITRAALMRQRLIEDVEWIVDHDNPHSVAKRVGYGKVGDLIAKLRCHNRHDLADKLTAGLERWGSYAEVPA